jgi:hypothetical protein
MLQSLFRQQVIRALTLGGCILAGMGQALQTSPASAAIITYDISNYPSIQDNATLSGTITVDTAGGTESPASSGNFFVSHSAITAWDWTVTPSVGSAYSVSSTGINPSASGDGSFFALYATPTTLSVVQASTLNLKADLDVPGATVALNYWYDSPLYGAGGTGVGGSTWLKFDRAGLDSAFPSYPVADAGNNWVIATAVPEPATASLIGAGLVGGFLKRFRLRRRR